MAELKPKVRQELAELYDLPQYKALKLLLDDERMNIAKKLLVWPANDIAGTAMLQGEAKALRELHRHIKDIHAQINKNI